MTDKDEVTTENLDDFLAGGEIEPRHPGIMYYNFVVKRGGVPISTIAEFANTSTDALQLLFKGEASITSRIAGGLAEAAGNTPAFWLRAQRIYDLWNERHRGKLTLDY